MAPEEICSQKEAVKALSTALSELSRKPGARSYAVTYYNHTEDDNAEEKTRVALAAIRVWESLALRCFRSDKLSVRRYGLEQVGGGLPLCPY